VAAQRGHGIPEAPHTTAAGGWPHGHGATSTKTKPRACPTWTPAPSTHAPSLWAWAYCLAVAFTHSSQVTGLAACPGSGPPPVSITASGSWQMPVSQSMHPPFRLPPVLAAATSRVCLVCPVCLSLPLPSPSTSPPSSPPSPPSVSASSASSSEKAKNKWASRPDQQKTGRIHLSQCVVSGPLWARFVGALTWWGRKNSDAGPVWEAPAGPGWGGAYGPGMGGACGPPGSGSRCTTCTQMPLPRAAHLWVGGGGGTIA
jgi:hypothetical protein